MGFKELKKYSLLTKEIGLDYRESKCLLKKYYSCIEKIFGGPILINIAIENLQKKKIEKITKEKIEEEILKEEKSSTYRAHSLANIISKLDLK